MDFLIIHRELECYKILFYALLVLKHFFIFDCMNRRIVTFQLLFVLTWAVASSQYTPIINSNRPGLTQGAFAVAPGVYQLEFGTSYRKDQFISLAQAKSQGAGFTLDLRMGLILQNLELIYRVDYHSDKLAFNNGSDLISYT